MTTKRGNSVLGSFDNRKVIVFGLWFGAVPFHMAILQVCQNLEQKHQVCKDFSIIGRNNLGWDKELK